MSARASLKKNTVLNAAGTVIPLVVAIVTVPLYLNSIGAARYGVLALVWLFTGYFSLLDFGISRATVNMVARIDPGDLPGQRRVLWSALWINSAMGVVGMCLAYPLAHYVFGLIRFDEPALRDELVRAIPWLCLTVPMTLVYGVLSGGLEARERFGAVNAMGVIGGLAIQLVPVIVAYQLSVRLDVLIPAIVLTRLLLFLVFAGIVQRVFPLGRPLRWDRATVRGLVVFGSWASVSGIISPVLEALDRFLIGARLSASEVATYTIPFSIADKLRILPRALARAAYPRLSSLPDEPARQLYRQLMVGSLNLLTPLVLMAVVAAKHLMLLWIKAPLDSLSGTVAIVLLCGAWFNSLALVPFVYLQARGRPNVTATIQLLEFVPFVLLLVVMVNAFGVVGAALAWAGRMVVDCVLLCLAARDTGADTIARLAAHGLVLCGVAAWSASRIPSWPELALAAAVCAAAGLAMNWNLIRRMLGLRQPATP